MRINKREFTPKASIIHASAGSGKTYRLAYKYIRDVVERPELYRNILAVTFTNKATEEMKRRILTHLHTLASGGESPYMEDLTRELPLSPAQIQHNAAEARALILHNYSRFTVLTIDRFFQRVLRAFIQELGIDIDYNLELDTSPLVAQSADALIEGITTDESLRRWLMNLLQERIDEGRKWSVRDAILSLKGELFKEEARQSLESQHSKEELSKVVQQINREGEQQLAHIKGLAQKALEFIGGDCDQFKGKSRSPAHIFRRIAESQKELPSLSTTQIEASEDLSKWCGKSDSASEPLAREMMRRLREITELYSQAQSSINTSRLLRENYRSFALMYDLYNKTQEICREQNTMLLGETSKILSEFITESDAPFIYEKVGNRFSRFMIDEFQDTSRREWNNFLPLLRNTLSQSDVGENPILIVGDIKQSIYRWRGGDWRILHSDVERELGEEYSEHINMRDNYRSYPNIVKFNNELIERVVQIENQNLNTELESAKESEKISPECYRELHGVVRKAYEEHSQNPKQESSRGGFIEITTHQEETPPIVEALCSAIERGYSPCDIMILTRTNRQAQMAAQTLLEFKNSCDDPRYHFDIMTQEALIIGNAPVSRFIMATLRLAIEPEDRVSRAIYNNFLGREYLDTELTPEERDSLHSIRMLSPIEALERIIMEYDLSKDKRCIAYIQAIHEQVINYCRGRIGDISLFLEWWGEKGASQSLRVERSRSAVEILTIHKAKGLERKVVIIPYCNWDCNPKASGVIKNYIWSEGNDPAQSPLGALPIEYRSTMEHSAFSQDYYRERVYTHIDNINTLYVATTRAVESLHMMIKEGRSGARGVGKLILEALPEGATKEEREGDEGGVIYRFGLPTSPQNGEEREGESDPFIMSRYRSYPQNLQLRLPSQRYREGEGFTPRELGVLMHRAFEESTSREEIIKRIDAMLSSGEMSHREREELLRSIERSFEDPRPREWFEGEWDMVRNESQIILPQEGDKGMRRPDRVMIRGDRAVVVDYKFGGLKGKGHHRQIQEYMRLLHDMGYTQVEGYIWYLRESEIVDVRHSS